MRFLLSIAAILILDQASKSWVMANFSSGQSLNIIEGIFRLVMVRNPGAAFGILQGKSWFFILTALFLISAVCYYQVKYHPPRLLSYSLGLIAGGALGNLIDRILYGSVVDFISIGWWPVFNVADMAICCGTALLAIYLLINGKSEAADGEN